ncbi:MAG: hypothetical protein QOG46_353, partial [Pseudonocardiales bacterium]|nr:hypothetical protein [Pseudonocardiales bacterium]
DVPRDHPLIPVSGRRHSQRRLGVQRQPIQRLTTPANRRTNVYFAAGVIRCRHPAAEELNTLHRVLSEEGPAADNNADRAVLLAARS